MVNKKLTARTLETVKSSTKRREIPDAHMSGLYFIA